MENSAADQGIIDKLRKHYSEDVFDISTFWKEEHGKQKELHYVVSRELDIPNKTTGQLEHRKINCIEIYIDDSNGDIIIKQILTCSPPNSTEQLGRGKDIIRRIIGFATQEMPGSRLIVEYDVSKISIHGKSFPLGGLKLLSKGETWYNSLGFYEKNYDENSAAIRNFLKPKERADFAEIERRLMELAAKPAAELSAEDRDYINRMFTKVPNKLRTMDTKLKLTANDKYSDLVYSSTRPTTQPYVVDPIPDAPVTKKRKRSATPGKKSAARTKTARRRSVADDTITGGRRKKRSRTRTRKNI